MNKILSMSLLALLALAPSARGQSVEDERRSHFGVIVTFSPPSDFQDKFKVLLDAEKVEARTQDFEIGMIVRGRQLGGDWGVSFIQKTYKDGSFADDRGQGCFQGNCFLEGDLDIMRDVRLRGVSIHKFAPFVTIKRRAQVGLTFGGGVAQASGTLERHSFHAEFLPPNQSIQHETVSQVDARELFLDGHKWIPIWKVEVAGTALIAPGLKVRVGGGINFTNYPAFSISGLYLIGAK